MDVRRGTPAMVIPWPSAATPQTPTLASTRRAGCLRAHGRVAGRSFGTTKFHAPRLALHPAGNRRGA